MITAEKVRQYLHHVGASKLILCGDPDQIADWSQQLWDFDFVEPDCVPGMNAATHAHAVLVLDPDWENQAAWTCSNWHTVIALFEGYDEQWAHKHHFGPALEDLHCWNGTEFTLVSEPQHVRLNQFYAADDFWQDSILPCWPDMEPYTKDCYILYAGAGDCAISCRQGHDVLQEIREAFIAGYTRILFYNGDEAVQAQSLMMCQRMAEYLNYSMHQELPNNTFIYICGAPDANIVYQDLCRKYDFSCDLLVKGYFRFELLHRGDYQKLDPGSQVYKYLQEPYNQSTPRPKKFLCFNRVPRGHRMMIAAKLKKCNLLDQGFFSFYPDYPDQPGEHLKRTFQELFPWSDSDPTHRADNKAFSDFVDQDIPCVLNRTTERDNPVEIVDDDVKYFRDSYFSIVNETVFYPHETFVLADLFKSTFMSEKTWKPIMAKHPFVIVGNWNTLGMLQTLGYKTFHPYIDETYDQRVDEYTRMEMVWEQIERLINMSDEEWLLLLKKIGPIVEHNFNHFLNFHKKMYIDSDSIASYF